MKAIILSGGQGTRLRPVTGELPKPMVPLFGRPLLEHILLLLRRNGITECALTLHCLPEVVEGWFGDGSDWGMQLHYFREEAPLGTAGSVRACEAFLEGEQDFLVLPGDCVCDFDLTEAIARHRETGALATLLLHPTADPLEYGLVHTDEEGRILRFVEKPGWSQVFTNQVNTGIYLFRREVLERIPSGEASDFSLDLFPALLSEEANLRGFVPYGYWRDVGSPEALLAAARDALDGKVRLELTLPRQKGGVWAEEPTETEAEILPPCWIGPGVTIGKGAMIGPHTVLEQGSTVGARSVVQGSMVLGASLGEGSAATGAILCRGASLGSGSVLGRHTVLGEDAVVEKNAILHPGVKIWPGLRVPAGGRLNASLTAGDSGGQLLFEEDGVLSGRLGTDLTPELMVTLGSILGSEGKVGLGGFGGPGSRTLQRAASSGITAAGGTVMRHDGSTAMSGAWFARSNGLPISLFLEQRGEDLRVHCFGRDGLPLPRARQRRLEQALLRDAVYRASPGQIGEEHFSGETDTSWLYEASRSALTAPMPPLTLTVPHRGLENRFLSDALTLMGCMVERVEHSGLPTLRIGPDGALTAADENGQRVSSETLLLLTVAILMEQGERTLALPSSAPASAERLAEQFGGTILRLGRDGCTARDSYAAHPPLWDPVYAACLIAGQLGRTGLGLSRLLASLPACAVCRTEVNLHRSRGELMQALADKHPGAEQLSDGLRFSVGSGSVWISPKIRSAALSISAEAADSEMAEELCALVREQAKELDS